MKNKLKKLCIILFSTVLLCVLCAFIAGCREKDGDKETVFGEQWRENLLPDEGKTWFFAGQDLDAVGGLEDYSQGYADYFGTPAGVTGYTNFDLQGLSELSNWGAGDINIKRYADSAAYEDCLIAIGLWCPGQHLNAIISGQYDDKLEAIAEFFKNAADHHFFLRIGYEFDYSGNDYPAEKYKAAFRYIVDGLKRHGATNFVSVWQSCGYEKADISAEETRLLNWYPGDEYVDWMAYSYFDTGEYTGAAMRRLARSKNKPVFLAEVTPKGYDLESKTGTSQWNGWYTEFINHVKTNIGVIRAVSYINQNWELQTQWRGQNWGNTKLQADTYVRTKWGMEITAQDSVFVHKKVQVNADKAYVPTEFDEPKAPAGSGTVIEAEWGETVGGTQIAEEPENASADKVAVMRASGDGIKFYNLPQGIGVSILYRALSDTQITVKTNDRQLNIALGATGTEEGYVNFELKTQDGDGIEITQNAGIEIVSAGDSELRVDALCIMPSIDVMFRLSGTEIDVNDPACERAGNASVYTISNASSGYAGTLSNSDGTGTGSMTFTATAQANAFALVFAKGPGGGSETGSTPLYVNGSKIAFTHVATGDWNAFGAYIVACQINVGDKIKIDREDPALNQTVNVDGIFLFDVGIFNATAQPPQTEEAPEVVSANGALLRSEPALSSGGQGNKVRVNPVRIVKKLQPGLTGAFYCREAFFNKFLYEPK